jgi:hypothetical protein
MKKKETSTTQGGKTAPSKPGNIILDKKATASSSRRGKVIPE